MHISFRAPDVESVSVSELAPAEGPPWVVTARLSGSKDGPYYVPDGCRVRLLVDGEYPLVPPQVHFMQTLQASPLARKIYGNINFIHHAFIRTAKTVKIQTPENSFSAV